MHTLSPYHSAFLGRKEWTGHLSILTCIYALRFIWRSGSTRAPNELEQSHKKEKEFRLGDFFDFLLNGIKFLACFGNCKVEDPHLLKYKGSGSFGDLVEPERQMNHIA